MSRGKVLGILIAVLVLAVAAVVVHTELIQHTPLIGNHKTAILTPTNNLAAQERLQKRNEQEELEHACAALHKLGATNKECPH